MKASPFIWLWEMFCKAVDYLTLDLVTGKSWVKKDGSRSALTEASPQEAERPHPWPVEPPLEQFQRESYVARHQPKQMTAWEIAHAQEAWEGHKAAREANHG